jgi:hypothetical protein
MKILYDDKISSMSITEGAVFSSTYTVDNVLDDIPQRCFMANGSEASIRATINTGIQAIFVSGLMADNATIKINDTTNSLTYSEVLNTARFSTLKWIGRNNSAQIPPSLDPFSISGFTGSVLSSPLTSNTTISDQLTGAPNTLELQANLTLGDNGDEEVILLLGLGSSESSIQNDWNGTALGAGTITIELKSLTDLKDSPIEGNAIAKWNQSSGATGRFDDSSDAVVNCINHGNVRVGSIVTVGGIDYQVTKIIGDGTENTDITLSNTVSDGSITSIKNPIRVGILRAGAVLGLENSQIGFSKALKDFSIRKPLINGGYRQIQKNVARQFTANAIMPIAQANNFFNFYHAFRSKPFPITALQGMADDQNESQDFSGFVYLIDAPEMTSVDGQGTYQNVSFNLCEVI